LILACPETCSCYRYSIRCFCSLLQHDQTCQSHWLQFYHDGFLIIE